MCERLLLVFLVAVSGLFAYDELLLDAQSSIVPKIVMLDKELSKKLVSGQVQIVVACDADDIDEAKAFASQILLKTQGKIGSYALKVITSDFATLLKNDMSALYVLRSSDANIKKAGLVAKSKGVMSFAYRRDDIENGIMICISIERSTIITLSRKAIRESGVHFVDSFYKIAKVVE